MSVVTSQSVAVSGSRQAHGGLGLLVSRCCGLLLGSVLVFGVSTARAQTLEQVREAVSGDSDDSRSQSSAPATSRRDSRDSSRSNESQNRRGLLSGLTVTDADDDANDDLNPNDSDDSESLTTAVSTGLFKMAFWTAGSLFIGDVNQPGLDGSRPQFDSRNEFASSSEFEDSGIESEFEVQDSSESIQYQTSDFGFARFPFEHDQVGYLNANPNDQASWRSSSLRSTVAYASDFDDLDWTTVDLLYEGTRSRLGIEGSFSRVNEELGSGVQDQLHLADVHVLWRRYQSETFLWRWGLGAQFLDDATGQRGGLSGTARFDWFVTRPVSISGEYDLARVGSATYQHLRLATGVHWRYVELSAGYDYRRFDSTDFSGPILGLTARY